MRCTRVLFPAVLALLLWLPAAAQEVISAHSGIVHFSEGAVFIDDQPLDRKFATFPAIKQDSTLRTEKGRAEVLLTPGVFLRLDENTAIRMRSNSLTDTRVEFLHGAAIVDSLDAPTASPVLLIYKNCQVRFPKQGVYRLDSDTELLQAYSGRAEVTQDGKLSHLDDSHLFFFSLGMQTDKVNEGTEDEFYDWARARNETITAENQLAAQSAADAGDMDNDPNAPMVPVPYPGSPNLSVPGYAVPGYDYGAGSALFNPFYSFGGGPFFPSMMFPVFIVRHPYGERWTNSKWPHTPYTPGSAPTGSRWPHRGTDAGMFGHGIGSSGWHSTTAGTASLPMRTPAYSTFRPLSPRIGTVSPGYSHMGYSHMRTAAPHPMAGGGAAHAAAHR